MKVATAETTERKFERLASEFESGTAHHSNPQVATRHPAYAEIVRMGSKVIPLIESRAKTDAKWHLMLREIRLFEVPNPKE